MIEFEIKRNHRKKVTLGRLNLYDAIFEDSPINEEI